MPYPTRSKKAKKNKSSWKEPKPYQLMDPAAVSDPSYIDYPSTPSSSGNYSTSVSDPTRSSSDIFFEYPQEKKVPDQKSKARAKGQLKADQVLARLNNLEPPATVETVVASPSSSGPCAPEKKRKKMEMEAAAAAGSSQEKKREKTEKAAIRRKKAQLKDFVGNKIQQVATAQNFLNECMKMMAKDDPPFANAAFSMGQLFGNQMKRALAKFQEDDGGDKK